MYVNTTHYPATRNIKNTYKTVEPNSQAVSAVLRFIANTETLLGSFRNLLTNSLSSRSITKLQTGRAISVSVDKSSASQFAKLFIGRFRLC